MVAASDSVNVVAALIAASVVLVVDEASAEVSVVFAVAAGLTTESVDVVGDAASG